MYVYMYYSICAAGLSDMGSHIYRILLPLRLGLDSPDQFDRRSHSVGRPVGHFLGGALLTLYSIPSSDAAFPL